MSPHPNTHHAGTTPTDRPLILAFATRDVGSLRRLRSYLARAFPRSRPTWLVPAGFVEDLGPVQAPPPHEVLPYEAGGLRSWPRKMGILRRLRTTRYHYCAFPPDFCYQLRLDVVALLPLLVRSRRLLVLDPEQGTRSLGKGGFLTLYFQAYLSFHTRRFLETLRRIHTHRFERRVRDYVDPLVFLLLAAGAHVLRLLRPRPTAGRGHKDGCGAHLAAQVPTVVFFISNLDMGGTQRQLLTLLEKSKGLFLAHSLLVYVPHDGPFPERFAKTGVPILTLSPAAEETGAARAKERFLQYNFPVTRVALRLHRLLRHMDTPFVLHCWEFKANVLGAVAAGLAGVPAVVSSVRNLSLWKKAWDGTWWYRPADILTARLNDCILANAEAVKKDYQRWARVPGTRIRTLQNGLDPADMPVGDPALKEETRQALGWDPGHPVVGWVGRLVPQKDPATFLDVARGLHAANPSLRFVLLGDGPLAADLKRSCRVAGLDHAVRFLGARTDAYRWMRIMDVLVMTSIIEGMPNVLIEALFMGIPAVATDAGGTREVIENGRTGFVVPVGDVRSLTARTRELVRDPGLRERFAQAGRLSAESRFHADRMVRQTARLYRERTPWGGGDAPQ